MDIQKIIYTFLFLGTNLLSFAQVNPMQINGDDNKMFDSIRENSKTPADSLEVFKPTIKDYLYWTPDSEKKPMDTTLSINSHYQQNTYNKDLFGYQRAANQGQALNPLTYNLDQQNKGMLPTGKSGLYLSPEEVKYYNVKTPTTHFSYENPVDEGHYLSTLFTHNINSRLNYALHFISQKSNGEYNRQLSENKNFGFSVNYKTKDNRYSLLTHFMDQSFKNNENGGIDEDGLTAFRDNDSNFSSRDRMTTNLLYSSSTFRSKRFHVNQSFGLIKKTRATDSTQVYFPLKLKYLFNYEKQKYTYEESSDESYYSDQTRTDDDDNYAQKEFNQMRNFAGLEYQWSQKLWVEAGAVYQTQKLSFPTANTWTAQAYTNNQVGIAGKAKLKLSDKLQLRAQTQFLQGDNLGSNYYLNAHINLSPIENYSLKAGIKIGNKNIPYNLFANQSFYEEFNYDNSNYDNQSYQTLFGELHIKPLKLELSAQFSNINNYVYVNTDYTLGQLGSAINYFNLQAHKQQQFGKYHIDAQAQYQVVTNNEEYLPLPKFIARLTAYYQAPIFQGKASLLGGISAYYYSKYQSRDFFPIINEFNLQQGTEIGNYPYIDLFIDMKVRRMRIYFRTENVSSFLLPGEYFYTPKQPARDFKIQIGINWFLFS